MSAPIDLDAYLARIGYTGPREPTLDTLHAVSMHHPTSIPFENLDVLLGRPIALTPEALMAKLVQARRGGYCFEQNNLLLLALRALGFNASLLGARVRGSILREEIPYRTHIIVKVTLPEGEFLADAGLGSASLTGAITNAPASPRLRNQPKNRAHVIRAHDMRNAHHHQLHHHENLDGTLHAVRCASAAARAPRSVR